MAGLIGFVVAQELLSTAGEMDMLGCCITSRRALCTLCPYSRRMTTRIRNPELIDAYPYAKTFPKSPLESDYLLI
jgi:hypothetical protein